MNLDWIQELIDILPEVSKSRKTLIDIAGYPKWENVNSNLLAFYLDEKEEHCFNRLFFNSLIDIIENKVPFSGEFSRSLFETDYEVEREVVTENGRRIDLVISEVSEDGNITESNSSTWSIIIENKIFASLYNDLEDYWKAIEADNKFGVVLSINQVTLDPKLQKKKILFTNILHTELVEKIKQNLSDYYVESDDRHLLFLKEYISNINSFYKEDEHMNKMNKTLQLFHSKKDEIEELKRTDLSLLRYVSKSVFSTMQSFGFPPYSAKDSSKTKHFYVNRDSEITSSTIQGNPEIASMFRFWINIGGLRYVNIFHAYFELWSKNHTTFGDKLKEALKNQNDYSKYVQIGSGGKSGAGHQHIYEIAIPIGSFIEEGFEAQLKAVLKNELFDKGYLDTAVRELKKIVQNK